MIFLSLFLLLTASSQVSCSENTITVSCWTKTIQLKVGYEFVMQAVFDNADEIWQCGRKHLYKLSADEQQYQQCLRNIRDFPSAEDFYTIKAGNFAYKAIFKHTLIAYGDNLCTEINRPETPGASDSNRFFASVSRRFVGSTDDSIPSEVSPKKKKKEVIVVSDDAEGGNGVFGFIILGLLVLAIGVACFIYFRRSKTSAAAVPVDPSLKLEANHQQQPLYSGQYYNQGYPVQQAYSQAYHPQGYPQPQQAYPQGYQQPQQQ